MLLALHGDLGQVDRQGVVHLVVLQVLLDEQGDDLAVGVFVDFACHGVLPLESC